MSQFISTKPFYSRMSDRITPIVRDNVVVRLQRSSSLTRQIAEELNTSSNTTTSTTDARVDADADAATVDTNAVVADSPLNKSLRNLENRRKLDFKLKKESIAFICSYLKQNKTTLEIVLDLKQKFGSKCITESTIRNWVAALKSPDRNYAKRNLGIDWLWHWDDLNRPKTNDESAPRRRSNSSSYSKRKSGHIPSTKRVKSSYEPNLKKEYFEHICECLRANKRTGEIIKELQARHRYECVSVSTIAGWIATLKSQQSRDQAVRTLGPKWIVYWDVMNNREESQEATTEPDQEDETNRVVESAPTASTMTQAEPPVVAETMPTSMDTNEAVSPATAMAVEESQNVAPTPINNINNNNTIEIKSERIDELDKRPPTVVLASRDNVPEPVIMSGNINNNNNSSTTNVIMKKVPECILGKATLNGQTYFMIKWKGFFEDELVLAEKFKYEYPILTMEFYETKLYGKK